jgi:hypothetical protein
MIRSLLLAAGLAFGLSGAALAQSESAKTPKKPAAAKAEAVKSEAAKAQGAKAKAGEKPKADAEETKSSGKGAKGKGKAEGGKPGKPKLSGAFGDWGAYVSQGAGKAKTCYALAQPKARTGGATGSGYIFIATRPAENVRGEISIMMGTPLKEGATGAAAEIGQETFALVAKGQNAWVKDTAEEKQLGEAMRKGSRLVVKAPSAKGATLTDSYSLTGLGQALDQVRKDCN